MGRYLSSRRMQGYRLSAPQAEEAVLTYRMPCLSTNRQILLRGARTTGYQGEPKQTRVWGCMAENTQDGFTGHSLLSEMRGTGY